MSKTCTRISIEGRWREVFILVTLRLLFGGLSEKGSKLMEGTKKIVHLQSQGIGASFMSKTSI
jgi:hypothetical protein